MEKWKRKSSWCRQNSPHGVVTVSRTMGLKYVNVSKEIPNFRKKTIVLEVFACPRRRRNAKTFVRARLRTEPWPFKMMTTLSPPSSSDRQRLSETPLILGAQNASVEVVAALLEEPGTDIAALNVSTHHVFVACSPR